MNRQEVIESAYRTGAVLTAAGVAFLGRIGVMPAMAMPEASTPNTPDHIQTANRQPKPSPEGVKVISTKSGQALENYQAFYPKVKYLEHAPEPNLPITATDLTGHMHNIHLNKAIPYASVNKLIK
jgi:hypothetical protein